MKKIAVATIVFILGVNVSIAAKDEADMDFDGGSVIIHCVAPTETDQIESEIFLNAFPQWITNLQIHANEGRVARAHFLSELKEGIFVVVVGDTKEQAMENALAIDAENTEVLKQAFADAGVDMGEGPLDSRCDMIEIGPVAILPQ